MTPNIAKRLALVFPTAALQEAGVTGVAGVADVTRYAKKPLEPRQLRPLRQENDNAGKMPDEGVVTDVAAPVAPEKSGVFALLRIGRDSWVGGRLAGLLRRASGHRRIRRRTARTGRGPRLHVLRRRVAQPQPGALLARQLPPLRRRRARPRPATAVRNRVHRPRVAAFALLVGLVRRQTGRGRRRRGGNGDRDTRVSKRFR